MKELLVSISNQNMIAQQDSLLDHHLRWKGKEEQVDDICVVG
jgi:hypothetical protein